MELVLSVFLFCPKPTFLLLGADEKLAKWVLGRKNTVLTASIANDGTNKEGRKIIIFDGLLLRRSM